MSADARSDAPTTARAPASVAARSTYDTYGRAVGRRCRARDAARADRHAVRVEEAARPLGLEAEPLPGAPPQRDGRAARGRAAARLADADAQGRGFGRVRADHLRHAAMLTSEQLHGLDGQSAALRLLRAAPGTYGMRVGPLPHGDAGMVRGRPIGCCAATTTGCGTAKAWGIVSRCFGFRAWRECEAAASRKSGRCSAAVEDVAGNAGFLNNFWAVQRRCEASRSRARQPIEDHVEFQGIHACASRRRSIDCRAGLVAKRRRRAQTRGSRAAKTQGSRGAETRRSGGTEMHRS